MRKYLIGVITIILALYAGCYSAKCQEKTVKREGKTFVAQKSSRTSSNSKDIKTSYDWRDSKGNTYPIYLHQYVKGENAGKWTAYVVRKSEKTGKVYKYYIPDGMIIAEQIMKEMGIK